MAQAPIWKAEEESLLIRMHSEGRSIYEISKALGRSLRSVQQRMNISGLKRKQVSKVWNEAELKSLREMWEVDLPVEEMALSLERTPSSIARKAWDLGLPKRPSVIKSLGWTEEEVAKAREMHAQGALAKDIAEELGRGVEGVKGKLHNLGLRVNSAPKKAPVRLVGVSKPKPIAVPKKAMAAARKYAKRLFAPVDHSLEAREARQAVRKIMHQKAQQNWVREMFGNCEIPKSTLKRLGLTAI